MSSYIVEMTIQDITSDADSDAVHVQFTSIQDPEYGHDGQQCSDWSMTYTMIYSGGSWLIDKAAPDAGTPTAC